ncbi:NAD(P)H-dependent oxidoreductase [Candidatus Kaiserbacteria bacterium]|nr:NAD(P)H-dependent oxidoreductase [Candidatus Kaiserbacteria bacterium]
MHILGISGSLRRQSYNSAVLSAMQPLAPAGMEIKIADLSGIPLYNQDDEAAFPVPAQALKDAIAAADGVIIATPEYNRSIPGVLKNAIDWASRPYGQNSFAGKPALVLGVSVGSIGTAVAQSHLRQILLHLDARVIGQPELYLGPAGQLFDASWNIIDAPTKDLLSKALAELASRVGTSYASAEGITTANAMSAA